MSATFDGLEALQAQFVDRASTVDNSVALGELEGEFRSKSGEFAALQRAVGQLEPSQRGAAGAALQAARVRVDEALAEARSRISVTERNQKLAAEKIVLGDIPFAGSFPVSVGHVSPVARTQDELEDVFVAMGFTVCDGPEIETDWYNFEALNIPPAHPARGMWDTLYLDIGEPETVLLRTHTSPVQVRLMQDAADKGSLPIHAVMPGRCFRRDTPDARHLMAFHQIEGLVIDRGITFADLAGVIDAFTKAYFGNDMSSRLRPAFFPFTEPSAEFEITCTICRGEGCRTCSNTGWIELGGCGMVDPAVLLAVGIDPNEYSGFAFGFGIDRCAQMRHQIPDMRALTDNDQRFLEQFS